MRPEGWRRVQQIFDAALEVDPAERRAFVRRECAREPGPESALEKHVLDLLEADRRLAEIDADHDFLEHTVLAGQTLVDLADEAEPSGLGSGLVPDRAESDPDLTGDFGKYRLLEKVGAGGFGQVYRARDTVLGREVAIKTCTSGDARIRQRFLREAKISAGLQHPQIVTVHDFGYHGEIPFLVQEFLDGEDLSGPIERREALEMERLVTLLLDIARGLAHAHDEGVLHRDVKPGNVRLLPSGQIKILDFGIARLRDHKSGVTSEGVTLGTVGYLAPEQLSGGVVDERSDLFAFGVLAYELLSFERPFRGETFSQVSYQLLFEKPVPIARRVEACPPALARLVERCLEKKPEARHDSFHDVIRILEALADDPTGSSTALEAVTESFSVARPTWRLPALLGGAALLALALFFSLGPESPPPGIASLDAESSVPAAMDEVRAETGDSGSVEESLAIESAVDSPPPDDPPLDDSPPADPALLEPVAPEPVAPEPVAPEPGAPEPGVPEPGVSEPVAPEPGVPEPGISEPGISEPSISEPSVSEPNVSDVFSEADTRSPRDLTDSNPGSATNAAEEVAPILVERAEPEYPPLARRRRLEGTVIVLAFVGPGGRVERTLVRSSSTPNVGFEEAALDAARRCRFEPGRRGGEPAGLWKDIAFDFTLARDGQSRP